jgi:flagellar motor component MotA
MSLIDSVLHSGKFLIGMAVGFVLMFAGLMIAGTSAGRLLSLIVGVVLIVVGGGFILWAERSRKKALSV